MRAAGRADEPGGYRCGDGSRRRSEPVRRRWRCFRLPFSCALSRSTSASTRGQFLLQIFLGALVIVIGEFADAIFELQVAQIFVDGGLALVQMVEGRDRFRVGQILGPHAQDERDDGDRDDDMRN